MNIKEIQTELAALVVQMTEKGVVTPSAVFDIRCNGRFSVYLTSRYGSGSFGKDDNSKFIFGDDALKAFAQAHDYLAALPSPEETQTREYLNRVASAIDYAAENGISDEYVTPLRGVTCAMTENLLTNQGAQS